MTFFNMPKEKFESLSEEQRRELIKFIDAKDGTRNPGHFSDVISREENNSVEKPTRKSKNGRH